MKGEDDVTVEASPEASKRLSGGGTNDKNGEKDALPSKSSTAAPVGPKCSLHVSSSKASWKKKNMVYGKNVPSQKLRIDDHDTSDSSKSGDDPIEGITSAQSGNQYDDSSFRSLNILSRVLNIFSYESDDDLDQILGVEKKSSKTSNKNPKEVSDRQNKISQSSQQITRPKTQEPLRTTDINGWKEFPKIQATPSEDSYSRCGISHFDYSTASASAQTREDNELGLGKIRVDPLRRHKERQQRCFFRSAIWCVLVTLCIALITTAVLFLLPEFEEKNDLTHGADKFAEALQDKQIQKTSEVLSSPPTLIPTTASGPATEKPSSAPTETSSVTPMMPPGQSPPTEPTEISTQTPSSTPSRTPSIDLSTTSLPTKKPTSTPTDLPSMSPTMFSTEETITVPTKLLYISPTMSPIKNKTIAPTKVVSVAPTRPPTQRPTGKPSSPPTKPPSMAPTMSPTKNMTSAPTKPPSMSPTMSPTKNTASAPTKPPSMAPTISPTKNPSSAPTKSPSMAPTKSPTKNPSSALINLSSIAPTRSPTKRPTGMPSSSPTKEQTVSPTGLPTLLPTKRPTRRPSSSNPADIIVSNFYVIGDLPYNDNERKRLIQHMNHVAPDAEFLVHVGDIRDGETMTECLRSEFEDVANILRQSPVPVFIVPGDNEYKDCQNLDESWGEWLAEFGNFEDHWDAPMKTSRDPTGEENFSFVHKRVLYIGLNLLGDNRENYNDWERRLDMRWQWTRNLIETHVRPLPSEASSVVIFAHADPRPFPSAPFFEPLKNYIRNELNNEIPIIYINGDRRYFQFDESFYGEPSFHRIMVEGGSTEPPLKMTFTVPNDPYHGALGIKDAYSYNRMLS